MNTTTPTTSVADVFRTGFTPYLLQYGMPHQDGVRAARAIITCRTPALGGHQYRCDHCGHELLHYNSCRNRNCPSCQTTRRIEWVHARIDELLPVGYFHVVFTIPDELAPFALRNQRVFYSLMFRSVNETLQELAADPKRLGAEIGFISVLHTWGQNLHHHPHIHCIVPAGGLDPAAGSWKPSRDNFLFPIGVMRKLFRGKIMGYFKTAVQSGEIACHGSLQQYQLPHAFQRLLDLLYAKTWVVYAKAPFASPQAVVKYLGQYTHRVAISNARLVKQEETSTGTMVTFAYKDYSDGNRRKLMTLSSVEFIRRFLMHVLPSGFVRIRHFGFMANRGRSTKLAAVRAFFKQSPPAVRKKGEKRPGPTWRQIVKELTGRDPSVCPACKRGTLCEVAAWLPGMMPPESCLNTRNREVLLLPMAVSG